MLGGVDMSVFHSVRELFLSRMDGKGGVGVEVEEEEEVINTHYTYLVCAHVCMSVRGCACLRACMHACECVCVLLCVCEYRTLTVVS